MKLIIGRVGEELHYGYSTSERFSRPVPNDNRAVQ